MYEGRRVVVGDNIRENGWGVIIEKTYAWGWGEIIEKTYVFSIITPHPTLMICFLYYYPAPPPSS
jgi:hypothetical protein